MAHLYKDKSQKVRIQLDNANRMRENVIEMQQHFANLPKEYQEHPDVAKAWTTANQLRNALESLL